MHNKNQMYVPNSRQVYGSDEDETRSLGNLNLSGPGFAQFVYLEKVDWMMLNQHGDRCNDSSADPDTGA